MADLRKEFEFYLAHRADLLAKYIGRVIVVVDERVIGDYPTEAEAVKAAVAAGNALGSFLVQRCEPGAETQTFHSRVAFA